MANAKRASETETRYTVSTLAKPSVWRRVKAEAARRGMAVWEAVEEAIELWLRKG